MNKRMLPLLLGLSVCSAAIAQNAPTNAPAPAAVPATQMTTTTVTWATPASGALTQDAIENSIANAGYKEIEGLKFTDGVWRTKARGGNKQWAKLAVGPVTGRVYPADAPAALNANEIKAKLTTAGFQNPTDVKFDDGLWSVSAKSPQGNDIHLLVDPTDGSVVAQSRE
jgi:hypothetical protein